MKIVPLTAGAASSDRSWNEDAISLPSISRCDSFEIKRTNVFKAAIRISCSES